MNIEHDRPRAAVVIIAYNDETHIERAIQSACNQTERNIEIICVDDGSIDSTYERMLRCAERDKRIKPVTQANGGTLGARYAGLRQVTSDYALFLDSDDVFMPEAVETACGAADEIGADVLEFGVALVKDESNPPAEETWAFLESYFSQTKPLPKTDHGADLLRACFAEQAITWNTCNKCHRTELLRKAFQFYQGERVCMEEDMLLMLMVLCQAKRYARIPAKLYAYTVGSGSSTTPEKLTSTDALIKVATEGLTLRLAREWIDKLGCAQDEVKSGMEALTAFIRKCILNHILSRVATEKREEYLKLLLQYCEKNEYFGLISEAISHQQGRIGLFEEQNRSLIEAAETQQAHVTQLEAQNRELTETADARQARVAQLEAQNRELTETAETRQARVAQLEAQNRELTETAETRQARVAQLEAQNREFTETAEKQQAHVEELEIWNQELQVRLETALAQLTSVSQSYDIISNSHTWRATKPLRAVLDAIKAGLLWGKLQLREKLTTGEKYSALFSKGTSSLKKYGVAYTIKKVKWYLKERGSPQHTIRENELDEILELEVCKEYRPSRELYQRLNGKTVDIIVPIYNGLNLLPPLLGSISRTEMPYHLFLIDDNSTDQNVLPMLREYAKKMGNTTVIENQKNLGYTCSINKALSLTKGHVVLLNTDVRLPMYWLERIMTPILMDSSVASVTPFTNSGTICSFPDFLKNNNLYLGLSVDEIDAVFARFDPQYTQIPTGVGFCMALSREALSAVGEYDEENFPRGYGEENDWCQRAVKSGFKNVMAENLFVYHQHGATFTTEEKQKLIESHGLLLNQKHPNYDADVQSYIRVDPVKKYRKMAQMLLFRHDAEKAPILAFTHSWGGGSAYYLNGKIKELTDLGRDFLTIQYFGGEEYKISRFFNGYSLSACRNSLDQLFSFLPERLDEVWVNELVSYPIIDQVLDQIRELSQKKTAKLVFRLHDFYCICPSITLLKHNTEFCGVPNPDECQECCRKHRNIIHWRTIWSSFLKECDEITAFSCSSADILKRAYPELEQVTIVPHTVKKLRVVSPVKKGKILTIGVIGAISEEKGLKILEQMAEIIHREKKPMEIRIIGYTSYNPGYEDVISCTGKYERDRLPEIIEKDGINIILIPSICPETFSYTTEESMMMGLPVAVFNIGAPAERVKKYEKGIVIREISADAAIRELEYYWEHR